MFDFPIVYGLLALAGLAAFAVVFLWPDESGDPMRKL